MRPILADTSWYIARTRQRKDPLLELAELSRSRDIAVCGMVVAELGRGIRHATTLQRYIESWNLMCYVPSDRKLWQETLELAWQLDRRGRVLPLPDLHIAACALSIGAVVLTMDTHFQEIPGLDATERIL
ncbi:MAG TPA: PIN domain-containing protein [Opitutales bacterium]|nr:PIN domain-containing protein [Opitutales bacterium]